MEDTTYNSLLINLAIASVILPLINDAVDDDEVEAKHVGGTWRGRIQGSRTATRMRLTVNRILAYGRKLRLQQKNASQWSQSATIEEMTPK